MSEPIRIVALDEIQRERERETRRSVELEKPTNTNRIITRRYRYYHGNIMKIGNSRSKTICNDYQNTYFTSIRKDREHMQFFRDVLLTRGKKTK